MVVEFLLQEMDDFIREGGSEGFIYFSFGSFVRFSSLPTSIRDVFINTFKKFKHIRFVWKAEADPLENNTDASNIYFTSKWIPQQAVLGIIRKKTCECASKVYSNQ
jgi:hypothetical protein